MSDPDSDLLASPGRPFSTGAATYLDAYPGRGETHPRIYVSFRPAGFRDSFLALLDTGAYYCILKDEVIRQVQDQLTDHLGSADVQTAYGPVHGELYLLNIELIAETGENLTFEAVAFINPEWRGPSFIGYTGVLDRLRFAIDSKVNRFYFGWPH